MSPFGYFLVASLSANLTSVFSLFHVVPDQSTHNTGGIVGTDPKTTVVNRYLQAWDANNLFVMGALTRGLLLALNFPSAPSLSLSRKRGRGRGPSQRTQEAIEMSCRVV